MRSPDARGGELPAGSPRRLVTSAPAKWRTLGLIDRLWSDRTVRAIFVNGPHAVFVERERHAAGRRRGFRDEAHLLELVTRLAGRPESGMADFTLRDGSAGFVIFPPRRAGGSGPDPAPRRAGAGDARRAGGGGLLDRPVAELLRLGARGRLNMLVSGPRG